METLSTSKAAKQWQTVGIKHHHGINIPLFSLHSKESAGIGEFLDLIPLIDWISSLGMDVIQLLPINDTGNDKSPYNALSAHALNPIYLSLSQLPSLSPSLKEKLKKLQDLTSIVPIPYEKVREGKEEFLHEYFDKEFKNISQTPAFNKFLSANGWVEHYAHFRALKDHFGGRFWKEWPQDPPTVDYQFFLFLQFLCFEQLSKVSNHAKMKKVLLMGDLPILISKDSADVWANPELFEMGIGAGAPPDMYNKEGQDWGFPLYRWDSLEKTNYTWWKERLEFASNFYSMFRIDHVVGFFRIWGVPSGMKAKEGHFYPEDQALWIPQGQKIMEMMIDSSPMLPIGEDLGVVPPEVRLCLCQLGICGTKVMRWERYWNEDSRFIPISEYIRESLTTVSTHDSETLNLWWQNQVEESKIYAFSKGWQWQPQMSSDQLQQILYDSHHSASLFHVNLLQEYFSLFSDLVHEDPNNERINIPGILNDSNWCTRFRPSIEEIVSHKALSHLLKTLIS